MSPRARTTTKLAIAQAPLTGRQFRRLVDGALSESQWQKQVETALKSLGWWFSHNPPNVVVCPSCRTKIYRGIAKGIPDLWAIREESMLYLELKDEHSYPDPPQRTMMERISKVKRIIVDWARPRDRDRVQNMLVYPERYVTSSLTNRE